MLKLKKIKNKKIKRKRKLKKFQLNLKNSINKNQFG
jgi:hypothetical protein